MSKPIKESAVRRMIETIQIRNRCATVGELRELIKDLPDNASIFYDAWTGWKDMDDPCGIRVTKNELLIRDTLADVDPLQT